MTPQQPVDNMYLRTFTQALAVVGGAIPLAMALDVSLVELSRWMDGSEDPPLLVFSHAIALVRGNAGPAFPRKGSSFATTVNLFGKGR